ncbi:CRIB domain-containing protein RIC7-like [Hibiscus syriacus]|uniref:CRIB domain-containing protein RIC7-like n=1 Tax=Hibiscus syriacus TaxID=106335 RepID=UPI0019245CF9|nr:CRIB domain-containing protein RIC7-like [Hibiscus syriacus]
MASNNKMKGLLKGLRYISEIFENEKEPEMQIGLPTDVKHVAHIGWDGPSAAKSAPSWMNEFKSSPANNGDAREEDPRKSVSQDGINVEGPRSSSATDMAEVPKSSKRSSDSSTRNDSTGESTGKEKSDKPKHPKKSSKTTSSSSKEASENATKPKKKPKEPKEHKEPKEPKDPNEEDNQKKSSRRKKSKDSAEGSSRRSRTRDLDNGSDSGSVVGIREERLNGSGFEGEF